MTRMEVDYVLIKGNSSVGIEVKSGRQVTHLPGMNYFCKEFNIKKKILVGQGGIPLQEFLETDPIDFF